MKKSIEEKNIKKCKRFATVFTALIGVPLNILIAPFYGVFDVVEVSKNIHNRLSKSLYDEFYAKDESIDKDSMDE